jgi:hypothetical protein
MSAIPASLAPFFQEYELDQLTLEGSAATIIERILQYGNREEIHWLFSHYPIVQGFFCKLVWRPLVKNLKN